ncbi:MAG TPA: hypothetical protein VFP85_18630 [Vicinamibacterales bacterium]|nr:hypothetical protein [Vicinamibacterales bacterium]
MTAGTLAFRAIRKPRSATRPGVWQYVLKGDAWTVLASPVIYSTIVPLVLLDAWVTVYQAICFRLWKITRARRRDYFALDRHRLAYLNGIEKVNCLFCSYANGVFGYVREVAARTEQYWCPIRHGRRIRPPHGRYASFVPYGDEGRYRERLPALRAALRRK